MLPGKTNCKINQKRAEGRDGGGMEGRREGGRQRQRAHSSMNPSQTLPDTEDSVALFTFVKREHY